jgi:NADH-quinone oxidoreductase subunit L
MFNIFLILFGPVIGIRILFAVRRHLGWWAVAATATSLVGVVLSLLELSRGTSPVWQLPGLPNFPLVLTVTRQTGIYSLVVAVVSLIVTMYAVGYMSESTEKRRFFAVFLGFIAAMQGFILSGDIILLLVMWELMTLTSYILISFKREDSLSQMAGMRAFITTRVGDVGLYLAAFVFIATTGTSNLNAMSRISGGTALAVGLLLLFAAMVKSGQIPFGGWLRGAMAGPTPVSALLHSATMVAAGALLLIRFLPLLPPGAKLAVGLVGSVTVLLAGAIAAAQSDLKRLLAGSTSSQIGLIFVAVSAGSAVAASIHFAAHALMKSTLFMGAGIFQHDRGSTAFSKLRAVGRQRPYVFSLFGLAAAALAGLPPLAGFYSKDAVVAASAASGLPWLAAVAIAGTFFTGLYMATAVRQLYVGSSQPLPTNTGLSVMVGAMVPLIGLIVIFGSLVSSGSHFMRLDDVANIRLAVVDVLAAVIGLVVGLYGWFPVRLRSVLLDMSSKNYLERSLVTPLLRMAKYVALFETQLTRSVYAAASGVIKLGSTVSTSEVAFTGSVYTLGGRVLKTAQDVQSNIETPLTESYFSDGRELQRSAKRIGRTLQTGLIHREMAMAMLVMALLFALVSIMIIIGGR